MRIAVLISAAWLGVTAPAAAQETIPQGTWPPGQSGAAAETSTGEADGSVPARQPDESASADGTGASAESAEDRTADYAELARIEESTYSGGPLPEGQSAITAKVQMLLDRAHASPGVIDGWRGPMTRSAIRAFEQRHGLPADGRMDADVWAALAPQRNRPVTQSYTITGEDTDVVGPLPRDYSEKAKYRRLGYQRVTEGLAERFHMDEDFLRQMNPDAGFRAGETITVMAPGAPADGEVARIRIDKPGKRLYALDAAGSPIASYPVAIGSAENPSPSGSYEVTLIQEDPYYNYDPDNFVQGDNYQKLTLPPGPNNPVGKVWIALSRPSYGIHGTPEPAGLFRAQSHGCVRMTNWDALALAAMVEKGTPVAFVD